MVNGENIEVDFVSGVSTGYVNFELWVNTAPTLDASGSPTLPPILVNDSNPPGAVVAGIIGDSIADPDPEAREGVAVTGLTGLANGTWQYSLDGGVPGRTSEPSRRVRADCCESPT